MPFLLIKLRKLAYEYIKFQHFWDFIFFKDFSKPGNKHSMTFPWFSMTIRTLYTEKSKMLAIHAHSC